MGEERKTSEAPRNGNGFTPTWHWFIRMLAGAAVMGVVGAAWGSYQRLERVEVAVSGIPEQTRLLRVICRQGAPDPLSRLECGPLP